MIVIYFAAIAYPVILFGVVLVNVRQARLIKRLEGQNERLADRIRRDAT